MPYRLLVVLLVVLSLPTLGFSSTVNIVSDVYSDKTEFTYTISFNESENYDSFSFEKPRDARLLVARDEENRSIRYTAAGDYFIFRPEETVGNRYRVVFTSVETSRQIASKNAFSTYVNFNVPVERLNFSLNLQDNVGEITEVFPRSYRLDDSGSLFWSLEGVQRDTLFLVNFRDESGGLFLPRLSGTMLYGALFALFFIVVGSAAGVLVYLKLLRFRKSAGRKENRGISEDDTQKTDGIESQKHHQLDVDTVIEKYLTENEGEVVDVIRNHQGISQYDILNYLPHLSKSNLSKIITKLHSKRYLNRIKVGKVNKIYLGEKLNPSEGEDRE